MNNYEQDANVILKMTKVVHPDYVINSIAQFLKERDTKQKLNIHSVVRPASALSDGGEPLKSEGVEKGVCGGPCLDYMTACEKCLDEYWEWKQKQSG